MGLPKNFSKLWNDGSTASFTEVINAIAVCIFAFIWIVALITFAITCKTDDLCFFRVFSKILVVSLASYFIGGLIGFIFGIPKSLQNPDKATQDTSNQNQSAIQHIFYTNTSLEQISDWLTKIIVGVTLVNLGKVPSYFENLRKSLEIIFPGPDSTASGYAIALIIYSAIVGFLTLYIYTRVNLAAQFVKEAFDNDQYTNDIVKKAGVDPQFKTDLIKKLN